MATISSDERAVVGDLNLRRYWNAFSETERRQMMSDDIRAGLTVSMILTGVIFSGVVIGLIGVLLSLSLR